MYGVLLETSQFASDIFGEAKLQESTVGGVQRLKKDLPGAITTPKEYTLFEPLYELLFAVLALLPLPIEPSFELPYQVAVIGSQVEFGVAGEAALGQVTRTDGGEVTKLTSK